MAIIPLNISLTNVWKEITTDIFNIFEDKYGIEFYLPYEHTKTLEIIVDTSGVAVIDENDNFTGTKLDRYFLSTSTRLNTTYRYYARAYDTIATISIKDKGNAVSIEGVDVYKGAINVHDADVHNVPYNEFFHEHTGIDTTLAVAAAKGDTAITVADATNILVGDTLQIENGIAETTFPQVTIKVGNLLTLDRPLDYSFTIGGLVEVVDDEMAVNATLAAPRSFKLIPDGNQVWHVISVTIVMTHSSAGDDSKFGDIAALINGLVFRGYNGTADQYVTLTNWKKNGDFYVDFGVVDYTDKAGGGLHGTKGSIAIKVRAGAIPSIDGSKGDYLEVLVQDNVTAIESIRVKSQGHIII